LSATDLNLPDRLRFFNRFAGKVMRVAFSFLVFSVRFDIFRACAMLMVFYSDLSIGQMLAVFVTSGL